MSTFLIGLTGNAGTGKDTVRAILEDLGFVGFAFADPIRGMLRELLTSNGFDDAYMDKRELKEAPIPGLGVSYRHMAQTLGTEWGRWQMPKDFWLTIAEGYLQEQQQEGCNQFVVSDVRFANEAEWVRSRGGLIWRVQRSSAEAVRAHISEVQLNQIEPDWTIYNDGSIDELRAHVSEVLESMV